MRTRDPLQGQSVTAGLMRAKIMADTQGIEREPFNPMMQVKSLPRVESRVHNEGIKKFMVGSQIKQAMPS